MMATFASFCADPILSFYSNIKATIKTNPGTQLQRKQQLLRFSQCSTTPGRSPLEPPSKLAQNRPPQSPGL
jgi:hypothetical protein